MTTPRSSRMAAGGLTVMLISVSAGIQFGADDIGLLLCFCFGGVLVGASLIVAGVRMADGRAPITPMVFDGARDLLVFMCRNTAVMGLVMTSCAFMAVSGEEDPVLCFVLFVLALLGLTLVNIGAHYE